MNSVDSSTASSVSLRPAEPSDEPFLEQMLIVAFNFDGTERVPLSELRSKEMPIYVSGWGRDGDVGLVAELDGRPVGAAWARLFDAEANTYGHVAPDVPELVCIGVTDAAQGRGVGSTLFDSLVSELERRGYRGVSLSVEDDNSKARTMYERRGFSAVDRKFDADVLMRVFSP